MSVTSALGFRAAGVTAGLKPSGRPDLALVVNDGPTHAAAGVFTANRVKAAPVLWSRPVLADGVLRAVVLNAGNANACTGSHGFADAHRTAETVGGALGVSAADVAVCSTGLIGEYLRIDALLAAVPEAAEQLSDAGGAAAAEAIMTTDTRPKSTSVSGAGYTVGGMAKGAGMLAPAMATMLAVITTDAVADVALDGILHESVRTTFGRVDSDGCLSTNDTVLLLASGASGHTPGEAELGEHVTEVCRQLARELVADAEGATKDIRIDVVDAASEHDALEVGRAVARSALLKCAVHGEDPNWGRVLAAVGTTAAAFEPDELAVAVGGVWVCRDGTRGEDRRRVDMTGREVTLTVSLGAGQRSATIWTNDLTPGYVHENSAYST